MTLPVTFARAAYAEFIEAVAWYEAQRPGSSPTAFRTAFTFARR